MRVEPTCGISSVGAIKPVESVTSKPKISDVSYTTVVNSISNINNEIYQTNKILYQEPYLLDISARGLEIVKQYQNDYYPIVNSNVFSYTKNLSFIYKGY